jgi:uncharacterized phage protein gp47/JayE
MYEDLTVESIKSDIISRLSTDIDTREGSFANDMISAVAYEIWKAYQSLNAIIPIAFVDETSGEYIDKRCAEYGITRKAGTKATVTLTLTGTDGTVVEKGKIFLTPDGLQFETDESVTIANGTAAVTATAAEIGEEYNVAAGTITKQLVNINGLTAVTNNEAATGGTDVETDAALVKRLYEYLQNPATSGNVAHYRQWALEVDGVGAAKVYPLWNGPGTVKVLIVGNNNGPVDSTIVANCAAHIEENRPIGATVTVESAEGLPINVAATVVIDDTTTIDKVQTALETALDSYLQSIVFDKYTLVYNRIAYMLLDIDGVTDYTSLTINGGTSNIAIADNQVPVIGTVEVSA